MVGVRTSLCLMLCSTVMLVAAAEPASANWPRWRGPDGTGHTTDTDLPVKFGSADVAWRTPLDGIGQSSPIIWENRLFVTTSKAVTDGVQRYVHCLAVDSGRVLWSTLISTTRGEAIHTMNTHATSSCCTDGERVFAYFGQGGIVCLDMEGKKQWFHDLGQFGGPWGTAASPVIVDNMVIQNCDAQGDSYLIAYDKQRGKQIWKTERRAKPRGGWGTPIMIQADNRRELVLNGEFGVCGYDPETGKELWFCRGFNGRGTPTPAVGLKENLLFVVNGKPGDIYAVQPGGRGDVTETRMAWHTRRGGDRDLPSPIYVGGYVFVVSMKGIATMYEAASGREIYKARLGGNFSASPIAAGGLIYIQSEEGAVVVVRPGKKLDIVARNEIGSEAGEIFRASLAPNRGQLLARSSAAVYSIGKQSGGK